MLRRAPAPESERPRQEWRGRRDLAVRGRLVLLAVACVVGGLAVAAGLALHHASLERQAIEQSAREAARDNARAIDREIAAARARLEGLSASPALRTGDLRAFYDQLVATPVPAGSWFVLLDTRRPLLNTLRPFGAPLPAGPAETDEALNEAVSGKRFYVTNLVFGPAAEQYFIGTGLPILDAGGATAYVLAMSFPRARLVGILREPGLPEDWVSTVFDRKGVALARSDSADHPAAYPHVSALATRIGDAEQDGAFVGAARDGAPVFVAFDRSASAGWVTVVEVPLAVVQAPMRRVLLLIAGSGGLLLLIASGLARLLARGIERPIEALSASWTFVAQRLHATWTRYRTYWNHTDDALFVILVTEDGRFVFEGVNPAYRRAGLGVRRVRGKEVGACLPPDIAAAVIAQCRSCVREGRPVRYEETRDLPAGRRHCETSLAPARDPETGRIALLLGSTRDVTERRQVEDELRRLTGQLLATQDEERRRIARELHDSTAQNLLGASLGIDRALRLAPRLPSLARAALQECRQLIEQSQLELRTVSYLLHPPLLDEAGLPSALGWYIDGFARRSGIAVDIEVARELLDRRLPREVETALYRVAQEALTNVHRHSGSATARVRLARSERRGQAEIRLTIEDDGRGAPADPVAAAPGVGVIGMRERLRQLGGELAIRSSPSGTTVEASIPAAAVPDGASVGNEERRAITRPSSS